MNPDSKFTLTIDALSNLFSYILIIALYFKESIKNVPRVFGRLVSMSQNAYCVTLMQLRIGIRKIEILLNADIPLVC